MSSLYEDALISNAAYDTPAGAEARAILYELGWRSAGTSNEMLLDEDFDDAIRNGFSAEAFQSPTGEIVIGFRGTEFATQGMAKDVVADIMLGVAGNPGQKDSAIAFTQAVIRGNAIEDIHLTGHSLGGYLAQEAKYWLDTKGQDIEAFNGIESTGTGLNDPGMGMVDDALTDNAFIHVHDTGDVVNYFGFEHLGESVIRVDGSGDFSVLNPLGGHGIVDLRSYIASNPWMNLSAKEILSWDTDKKASFVKFLETGVEEINDSSDWEHDGIGVWNGNIDDFAVADFDSIMDGMDLDGLDWGKGEAPGGAPGDVLAPELQSVYGLYQAMQGSNDYAKLTAGLNVIGQLDGADTELDHFLAENPSFDAAQSVFAVYSFYQALESDEGLAAASSGLRMLDSMGVNIPGMPYLSLTTAVISGDPDSIIAAGLAMIPGYGWIASAVFSALAKPPPAHAWSDFTLNEDGSIDVDIDSNSSGAGLEASVSAYTDALLGVLHNTRGLLQDNNLEFKQGYVPRFGMRESEVYLEQISANGAGRITVRNYIDPDDALGAMRDSVVFESMVENGLTSFNPSPYLGDTDWSHSVSGSGVFAGGGNVGGSRGTAHAKDSDIKRLALPPISPAIKTLAEVTKTWRLDQNLFAGEGGKLLAMGLGAGIVDFDRVISAEVPEQNVQSITESEVFASLLAGIEEPVIVAGEGRVSAVLGPDDQPAPNAMNYEAQRVQHFASYYVPAVENFGLDLNHSRETVPPVNVDGSTSVLEFDSALIRNLSSAGNVAVDAVEATLADPEPLDSVLGGKEWGEPGDDGGYHRSETTPLQTTISQPQITGADEILSLGGVDHLSMIEDRDLYTNVETLLANDQQGVEFIGLGEVKHGTVNLNAEGEIYFVPDADYAGDAAGFAYILKYAGGDEQSIWVTVEVENVNDRPDAVDDAITALEDTVVNLSDALANDVDVDGDELRIVTFSQPQHGQISINSAGVYLFTPEADYTGAVDLMYVLEDTHGARSIAHSHIQYTEGENDAPRVSNEYFTDGIEETPYTLNVDSLLANDVDPEGSGLHLGAIRMLNGGEARYQPNSGEIVVLPDANFNGGAVLEYEVMDARGASRSATATVYFANTADAFSATDQTTQINEDAVTIFTPQYLSATADNPDGETFVTAVRMAAGSEGQVVRLPDGSVQFFPAPDFVGETVIEVRLSNGHERIVSRINITVNAVNDAPYAEDDYFDGLEDTVHRLNVSDLLDNDSDVEGDAFAVVAVELAFPENGQLSFNQANGEIIFTPAANFNGEAILNYTVRETQSGLERSARATITLAAVDDTAILSDKGFVVDEDVVREFSLNELLDVLQDVDGEALSITAFHLADPATGILQITAQGGLEFTPAADYSGEALFNIEVSDGVTTQSATMSVNVAALNDAPRLLDDRFTNAREDEVYHFNVSELTANDTDVEADAFEVSGIKLADPSQGVLSWDAATGEVVITSEDDLNGEITLSYTVDEMQSGRQSTARATVVFAAQNDTADITDKAFVLAEDETRLFSKAALLDVLVDIDGDRLSIQNPRLSDPAAGSIEMTAEGNVLFTPTLEYSGELSFDIEVLDPGDASMTTTTIHLSVVNENDAPVGGSPRFEALEDTAYTFTVAALLAGASDAEGDAIELLSVAVADPATGTLNWDPASDEIVFMPARDYFGEVGLEYVLSDSLGAQSRNRATLVFAGIDDPARLSEKHFHIVEDQVTIFTPAALLDEPIDVDGEVWGIQAARLSNEAAGVMRVVDGSVQFVPAAEFSGALSFDIDVSDGVTMQTLTMALSIEAVNDAPVAVDDAFVDALEDQAYHLNISDLLANDQDAEGDTFEVVGIEVMDTSQGEVRWDQASGEIVFTPTDNFNGEARLSYTLQETQSGLESTAMAGIVFAAVNDTAHITDKDYKDQRFNLFEDEIKVFSKAALLGVSEDVDGETLSIASVNIDPAYGSVEVTPSGNVRFVPTADYFGEAMFEIEVDDGTGETTHAQMTLKLWPVNDDPVAQDDNGYQMDEDTQLVIEANAILANDSDAEAQALNIVGVWASSTGVASYDVNARQLSFMPGNDVFGSAWVDYIVEDTSGGWDVARINIDIANTDDPMVAVDDMLLLEEDAAAVWSAEAFTANDVNPDQESLTITAIDTSTIAHGSLWLNPDGTVEYAPEADYSGVQRFNYTVSDQSGDSSQASVTLGVEEVNDAPVVSLDMERVLEDEQIRIGFDSLLVNAFDTEGDWMSIVGVRTDFGEVSLDEASQRLSFLPATNLNSQLHGGPIAVEYLVADERGAETWANIDVDVVPVNDPPQAYDDIVLAWESGPGGYSNLLLGDWLTANDVDVDGETIWVDDITQGDNGVVNLNEAAQRLDYHANAGFIGEDSFHYRVADGGENSNDWAQVTVHVMDNHAPVASDFGAIAAEDAILRFAWSDIAPYVYDEDLNYAELPEEIELVSVSGATQGDVTLNADGSIRFEPTDNYNSEQHGDVATFNFTVEDIVGNQSTATASIVYTPVNDSPQGAAEIIGGAREDDADFTLTSGQLLRGDTDLDGDTLSIARVWGTAHGSIQMNPNGQVHYTPDHDYNGRESFFYRVVDGHGGYDDVRSFIDVAAVNDKPVVQYDHASGDDDGRNFYSQSSLLGNDYDVDGDSLYISNVRGASLSAGGIAYSGPAGQHTIFYTVNDGHGGSAESRLTLDIAHVNQPPSFSGGGAGLGWESSPQIFWANAWDQEDQDHGRNYNLNISASAGIDITASGHNEGNQGYSWDITGRDPNYAQGSFYYTSVTFTAGVSDSEGAQNSASKTVQLRVAGSLYEGGQHPVVIDMDGDGLKLQSYRDSGALFDWQEDGDLDRTGWITAGDGLLAYDHDHDGVINQQSEISFVDYLEGAKTDLEGLNAFDSNADGLLTLGDEQWPLFGVWMDNGDGIDQDGEFVSLDDAGVQSISLSSDGMEYDMNGNHVYGTTDVVFDDGTMRDAGDVKFSYAINSDEVAGEEVDQNNAVIEQTSQGSSAQDGEAALSELNETRNTALAGSAVAEHNSDQTSHTETSVAETSVAETSVVLDSSQVDAPLVLGDLGLPDDSELDRMAFADTERIASRPATEDVPPVEHLDVIFAPEVAETQEQDEEQFLLS